MISLFRFLAICTITVAFAAVGSAQSYKSIDFPGATGTFLIGNNPEGTTLGSYVDAAGVQHGFVLKKGIFTSFDPPGSISTSPDGISPQGVIVGEYFDSSSVSHGFVLNAGQYT